MKPFSFKNYLIVQVFKKTNKVRPFYSYSIVEPYYSLYPLSELYNRHFLFGLVGLFISSVGCQEPSKIFYLLLYLSSTDQIKKTREPSKTTEKVHLNKKEGNYLLYNR